MSTTADFSSEAMDARRKYCLFQELKGKNCQPRILCPEQHPSGMKENLRHYQKKEN